MSKERESLVTHIYTADPSAHVYDGKIYIYSSHDLPHDEEDNDNFDTLNGLLVSRLGHIPEDDERADVQIGDYRFNIAGVEGKTIQTVVASRQAVSESLKPEENGLPSP